MIPSLECWPTKAKDAPSPHEVKLTPVDTKPVFQCLGVSSYDYGLLLGFKLGLLLMTMGVPSRYSNTITIQKTVVMECFLYKVVNL